MPLSVFFSNSLDVLADQFAVRLAQDWKDPFEPPKIIVPSVQVAHWLRDTMLKKQGAEAVWTHCFLDRFIQAQIRCYKGRSPAADEKKITSAEQLQLSVLWLLQGMTKEQCRWLYGPPGAEAESPIPERLLQLSSAISRLFLEYFSSRIELAEAWGAGRNFFSDGKTQREKDEEKFQRELYKKLLDNDEIWTIAHELVLLRRQSPGRTADEENAPVYLFNVSGLGMAYHEFLALEAQRRDIIAYVLNPCAAFWEDVKTIRDLRRERRYSLKRLKEYNPDSDRDENPLLRSWGDFGKRVIKMWSERAGDYANTEYLEKPAIAEGEKGSILKRIRQAALLRMPGEKAAPGNDRQESDGSLAVFACKGRLRQIEVLRDWIVDLLHNDSASSKKLMLNDIGVYLPDAAACAVEISLVFGAYPRYHPLHIPWTFEGRRADASVYANAVRAYLALMDGPFTRPQVLDFVSNPLVMEKTGSAAADIIAWTGWITSLNIFRGFDRAHRKEVDSCDSLSHTWRQGMDRLLLGCVAAGPVYMGEERYLPYRDISTGDEDCLCRFVAAVTGIWKDNLALHEALAGDNGWEKAAALLGENLAQWLEPADGAESAVQAGFLDALSVTVNNGRRLPVTNAGSGAAPLFLGWAASLVPEQTAGRAGPGGVLVFRTLKTGNVFPFRVMALVNFGAIDFPGENAPRPLDLRPMRPQDDDTDPLRRNRHAFLEAVVSARDRLAIFYPSIDTASGEETAPSSSVLELLSAAGLDLKRFRTDTPLCAEEGFDAADSRVAKNPFPVMDGFAKLLANEMKKNPEKATGPAPAAAQNNSAPCLGIGHRRVKLGAVKRWLEDPFTHRIEAALGRDDSEETAEALLDEEPFATAFLDRLGLVRTLWDAAISDFAGRGAGGAAALCSMPDDEREKTWRGYFETAYGLMRLECRTPEGFLGAIDKTELYGEVKDYLQGLWDGIRAVAGLASVEILRVGRGAQAGAPPRENMVFHNVPASGQKVVLEGAPQTGFWEVNTNNPQNILHLFVAVYPGLGRDKKARYCLIPWLSAQAAAVAQGRDFTCAIHLIDRERQEPVMIDIQHKAAAAYLENILAEYCGGVAVEHLPLQAVESIVQGWQLPLEEIDNSVVVQWLDTDSGSQYRRYKYYSEFIDLLQPPVSSNARETVKRRLGPLIDACYRREVPAAGEGEAACSGK
jgi:exonuclease V gamma subunit